MKMALFKKLKSDWNKTWFIDIIWDLHMFMWSKVIYQGQRSSEVKL